MVFIPPWQTVDCFHSQVADARGDKRARDFLSGSLWEGRSSLPKELSSRLPVGLCRCSRRTSARRVSPAVSWRRKRIALRFHMR